MMLVPLSQQRAVLEKLSREDFQGVVRESGLLWAYKVLVEPVSLLHLE